MILETDINSSSQPREDWEDDEFSFVQVGYGLRGVFWFFFQDAIMGHQDIPSLKLNIAREKWWLGDYFHYFALGFWPSFWGFCCFVQGGYHSF